MMMMYEVAVAKAGVDAVAMEVVELVERVLGGGGGGVIEVEVGRSVNETPARAQRDV